MKLKRRRAPASHSLSPRSEAERGEGGVRGRAKRTTPAASVPCCSHAAVVPAQCVRTITPAAAIGGIVIAGMNVLGMQASRCRVGEVANEKLAEAAGPQVQGRGVRTAPVRARIGAARAMHWTDMVWLTTAGNFWPIVLSSVSAGILIKLMFSPFEDRTFGFAAWLTLVWTWFHVPLWATAREVPYDAAVVGRDGRVHIVREETRNPALKVRFLTDQPGTKIVHNVAGKMIASAARARVPLCRALHRYAPPQRGPRRAPRACRERDTRGAGRAAPLIENRAYREPRGSGSRARRASAAPRSETALRARSR